MHLRRLSLGLSSICIFLATANCQAQDWSAARFDEQIASIFTAHCLDCHSGPEPKGDLDLSEKTATFRGGESGAGVTAGDLEQSLIWQRIAAAEMPPENPLPAAESHLIREWILRGAIWGTNPIDTFRRSTGKRAGYDWWSLQPIQRPKIPPVDGIGKAVDGIGKADGIGNPIDTLVQARLQTVGLKPSPLAAPRVIMRRLSFGLLGLPPSPEAVHEFEFAMGQDQDAALNRLIDQLLASRHFGERWGRHWLDVVRFGESQGFERDKLRENSWYYRDWVIHAMNADMPYDQFAQLQLAGDVLHPNDPDSVTATGFLVAGPWDEVGQSMQSDAMRAVVRQDEIEDYVGTIGQAFLGLTVNCARCHDHKFDPIQQKEYYRLAAALAGVRHGSREVVSAANRNRTEENYSVYAVKPGRAGVTHLLIRGNPAQQADVVTPGGIESVFEVPADFGLAADSADADRRRQIAKWITHEDNPLFARVIVNRLWHYHFGAGLVTTPNDFGFNGGRPSHPALIDYLASELIESDWSLKHIHRLIVSSATYLQASRYRAECAAIDADNRLLWRKTPLRLEAESLRDSLLSVSGQLNPRYGGPPYRDFKTFVNNSQFYEMIDADNPDVYRRTVYRTWIRSGRNHLLDVFDCPDPSTTTPKRSMTTTPLQALTLMNNSFVLRMADRLAERVIEDVGVDAATQATRVYNLAFGRQPSREELDLSQTFIAEHDLSAFCRVILNSNEFIHVD